MHSPPAAPQDLHSGLMARIPTNYIMIAPSVQSPKRHVCVVQERAVCLIAPRI